MVRRDALIASCFPFLIPGDIRTPTGGYAYARRLIRDGASRELKLEPVSLPAGFPLPSPEELATSERVLSALPPDRPVLIDGLAYGGLPRPLIRQVAPPIVALCHHPLFMEAGHPPEIVAHLRRTEEAALGAAAHVVTTSHATADIVMHAFGVESDRITVAPPGTDPAPRAPVRSEGSCRILSVGSLTPRKGHLRLIEALALSKDLDWRLQIAGAEGDGTMRPLLESRIAEMGLAGRVELLGPLSIGSLTAAFQQSDLFALASGYEGFGMAFTEAMSHGLPVVGLNVPAVAEATAGGACLVEEGELAATLRRLIENREERAALGDRAWTAAQTFLRWHQTATIVRDVLRKETP